jgi:ATP-binding cassette, subfamily C, bacterial CydC
MSARPAAVRARRLQRAGAFQPAQGPREPGDLAVLRRLLRLAAPARHRLALAAALGVATVLSSVGLLAVSGLLVTWASLQPPLLDLLVAIVAVRALGIARGVLRYGERLAAHDAAFRLLADLRVAVFARLRGLAPGGTVGLRRGDLLSRFIADVDALQHLFLRGLHPPVVAAAVLLVVVAVATALHPVAGAALAAGLLLVGLGGSALGHAVGERTGADLAPLRGRLGAQVVDLLAGAPELLANGVVEEHLAAIDRTQAALTQRARRAALLGGAVAALSTAAVGLTAVAVLAAALPDVGAGRLDPRMLALLVLGGMAAFEAMQPLPGALEHLRATIAAARRVFAVVDAAPPVDSPAEPLPAPPGERLTLGGVRLRYETEGAWVLDGVDLEVRRGRRVALVGANGAGKTTAARLCVRWRDPDEGTVRLDGVDVRRLRLSDLRRRVGLVEQGPHLFAGSLAANVRLGAPDADDDAVVAVLERVGLGPWLAGLPDGLATALGDDGVRVSGGQRQRIAVARVLLAGFPLLVLDEPTAGLDAAAAAALRRELLTATADRGCSSSPTTPRPLRTSTRSSSSSRAGWRSGGAPVPPLPFRCRSAPPATGRCGCRSAPSAPPTPASAAEAPHRQQGRRPRRPDRRGRPGRRRPPAASGPGPRRSRRRRPAWRRSPRRRRRPSPRDRRPTRRLRRRAPGRPAGPSPRRARSARRTPGGP